MLIKGGHEEGDALADALIETDNMTSWQGQRIETTSTHGTGCTLASAIATFLAQGSSLADAVARAREFVRVALFAAPGLGQGAGPIGQQNVRLDAGAPLRLNQVTVTGTDYERSVDFYRRLGLKQIVDNPPDYARFEMAGGAPSRSRSIPKKIIATTAVYLECDDLDERVELLARSGIRSSMARATSRGCGASAAARPGRQYHLPLQGGRGAALPAVADSGLIPHEGTKEEDKARRRRSSWLPFFFVPSCEIEFSTTCGYERLDPLCSGDSMPRRCSFKLELDFPQPLAGVDEAGCAPLAGPVVAAACILNREKFPRGIDDSKNLPLESARRSTNGW